VTDPGYSIQLAQQQEKNYEILSGRSKGSEGEDGNGSGNGSGMISFFSPFSSLLRNGATMMKYERARSTAGSGVGNMASKDNAKDVNDTKEVEDGKEKIQKGRDRSSSVEQKKTRSPTRPIPPTPPPTIPTIPTISTTAPPRNQAREILEAFIAKPSISMLIQTETVDQHKKLKRTTGGRDANNEIESRIREVKEDVKRLKKEVKRTPDGKHKDRRLRDIENAKENLRRHEETHQALAQRIKDDEERERDVVMDIVMDAKTKIESLSKRWKGKDKDPHTYDAEADS
jgi:uncharacterized protein (DUF2164 family)